MPTAGRSYNSFFYGIFYSIHNKKTSTKSTTPTNRYRSLSVADLEDAFASEPEEPRKVKTADVQISDRNNSPVLCKVRNTAVVTHATTTTTTIMNNVHTEGNMLERLLDKSERNLGESSPGSEFSARF